MPQAIAPYGHEITTIVRAPSGPRISIVATAMFNYGTSYDFAVRKSDNDLLAHEFPHAKVTNVAQNAPNNAS